MSGYGRQEPIEGQSHWCDWLVGKPGEIRHCCNIVANDSDHCAAGHKNAIMAGNRAAPRSFVKGGEPVVATSMETDGLVSSAAREATGMSPALPLNTSSAKTKDKRVVGPHEDGSFTCYACGKRINWTTKPLSHDDGTEACKDVTLDTHPEDCPERFWHETHRYCPVCTWTGEPSGEETPEQTIARLTARVTELEQEREMTLQGLKLCGGRGWACLEASFQP
jgi:hypothetical protein